MPNTLTVADQLPRLTTGQIRFLYRLCQAPNRAGFAIGPEEAGIISALSEKNFIKPLLKEGNSQRWQLSDEVWKEHQLVNELGEAVVRYNYE